MMKRRKVALSEEHENQHLYDQNDGSNKYGRYDNKDLSDTYYLSVTENIKLFLENSQNPDLTINKNNLLGEGFFSEVYPATTNKQEPVAFKRIRNASTFYEEVVIMHRANHPNIVKLLGCVIAPPNTGLVLELMSNGTLENYLLAEQNTGTPNLKLRNDIAQGIADGLCYLHTVAVILHLDLTPSNIMLHDNHQPKIIDFGLARRGSTFHTNAPFGSMRYVAPESFETTKGGRLSITYTQKTDIYKIALILYSLLINLKEHMLLCNVDAQTVAKLHRNGILEALALDKNKPVHALVIRCLNYNASNRPDITMVKAQLKI